MTASERSGEPDPSRVERERWSTRGVPPCRGILGQVVVVGVVVGVPALGWQLGGFAGALASSAFATVAVVAALRATTQPHVTGRAAGVIRLLVSLDLVAAAAAGLALVWGTVVAVPFAAVVVAHGWATRDRIGELVGSR